MVDKFCVNLIGLGHLNNTVVKNLRVFRRFINWYKEQSQGYVSEFLVEIEEKENEIDVIFLITRTLSNYIIFHYKAQLQIE